MSAKKLDLAGYRVGSLVAIKETGERDCRRNVLWLCLCDCGNTINVGAGPIKGKKISHCGCEVSGLSTTNIYKTWRTMKARCSNPKHSNYRRYGGRGIKVCDEWANSFIKFYYDFGHGHKEGLSIDRINNDGNYEPGNVRWATKYQQARNTSTNRFIEYKGERRCLIEWAELLKMSKSLLLSRLDSGWTPEKAFTHPIITASARKGIRVKLSREKFIQLGIDANKKPVLQYSKQMEFIKEWESIVLASKSVGVNDSCISANLHNKTKTSGGFIWKFKAQHT